MKKACCCYVVDQNYLLPALVSAIQARGNIHLPDVDVAICCVGGAASTLEMIRSICEHNRVRFLCAPAEILCGLPVVCARFFITRILSPEYERILYVDADTQIHGSLDDLISFPLLPGRILAASDPMSFMINNNGAGWVSRREYFLSIGIPRSCLARYFNAGVMSVSFSHWRDASQLCIDTYRNSAKKFAFQDQDVLNIILGAAQDRISLRWNFPVFFLNCGLGDIVSPIIRHFMSKPRPWEGQFLPWGEKEFSYYRRIVEQHPQLTPMLNPFRGLRLHKYNLQQRYKRIVERHIWNTPQVRNSILEHEQGALV